MARGTLPTSLGRQSSGGDPAITPLDIAFRANRVAIMHLFGIGSAITALGFTTSIYMLEVFGRVMSTRSASTLFGLAAAFLLASCVYVALISLRAAVLRRIGLAMDDAASGPVYDAVYARVLETRRMDRVGAIQDLDIVRRFWSSASLTSLLDLPWFPAYVIVLFAFHVVLGIAMLLGIVVVVVLGLAADFGNRSALRQANDSSSAEKDALGQAVREAEILHALGMVGRFRSRWLTQAQRAMSWSATAAAYSHNIGYIGKFLQSFVQYGMVALAAYLSILGQVSGGVMFAVMFIGGGGIGVARNVVAHLPTFITARQAHRRLQALFRSGLSDELQVSLPRPKGEVDVAGLAMAPGGSRLILSQVTFHVPAGATVAVIGPSGAGKSTLVRALVGIWAPSLGTVRLDGSELQHWDPDELGQHVGYLPQDVELLAGTIGENIARFGSPDAKAIRDAADLAGIHDVIDKLPLGYETKVGGGGRSLSGGQRQRIGLARAVYGAPALVVLDEPNANLDSLGEGALAETVSALKASATTCMIITHKANILTLADYVLVLKDGTVSKFGPRDEVMPSTPQPIGALGRRAAGARNP